MSNRGSIRNQLHKLRSTQDKQWIPYKDRRWFWKTFKVLKDSGWPYSKAWDMACWTLERHYGVD